MHSSTDDGVGALSEIFDGIDQPGQASNIALFSCAALRAKEGKHKHPKALRSSVHNSAHVGGCASTVQNPQSYC